MIPWNYTEKFFLLSSLSSGSILYCIFFSLHSCPFAIQCTVWVPKDYIFLPSSFILSILFFSSPELLSFGGLFCEGKEWNVKFMIFDKKLRFGWNLEAIQIHRESRPGHSHSTWLSEFNVLWSPCLFFLFLSCFVFQNIFSLSLLVVVNSPHDWMNEGWLNSNTRRDRKKREHSPPVSVHKYSHDRVCVLYIFSGENEMGKNGHQIRSSGLGTFFIMSIFSLKSFLLHCRFFPSVKKSI